MVEKLLNLILIFFLNLFSIKRKTQILELLKEDNHSKVRYVKLQIMLIINGCNCSINAFHHLEIKNKMFEFMHFMHSCCDETESSCSSSCSC